MGSEGSGHHMLSDALNKLLEDHPGEIVYDEEMGQESLSGPGKIGDRRHEEGHFLMRMHPWTGRLTPEPGSFVETAGQLWTRLFTEAAERHAGAAKLVFLNSIKSNVPLRKGQAEGNWAMSYPGAEWTVPDATVLSHAAKQAGVELRVLMLQRPLIDVARSITTSKYVPNRRQALCRGAPAAEQLVEQLRRMRGANHPMFCMRYTSARADAGRLAVFLGVPLFEQAALAVFRPPRNNSAWPIPKKPPSKKDLALLPGLENRTAAVNTDLELVCSEVAAEPAREARRKADLEHGEHREAAEKRTIGPWNGMVWAPVLILACVRAVARLVHHPKPPDGAKRPTPSGASSPV